MSEQTTLTRAAEHVGATRIDDGRWAYWAAETGRYYVVEESVLEDLCDYLDDEDDSISSDAYSHWCADAGADAEEMPKGWEPGQPKPYPAEVAKIVSIQRPDLNEGDAIATVLTADPTLTAQEVIDILDEAAEEWAAERANQNQ